MKNIIAFISPFLSLAIIGYFFWHNGILPDKVQLAADKFVNSYVNSELRLEARIRTLEIKIPLEDAGYSYGESMNMEPVTQAVSRNSRQGEGYATAAVAMSSGLTFRTAQEMTYYCKGVGKAAGDRLDMYGDAWRVTNDSCEVYISW